MHDTSFDAEMFVDAFVVTALYRRLRIAQKEHWLGIALRKTWAPTLLTAALLALGGWALEQMAPGAHSIGKAIEQLRKEADRGSTRSLTRDRANG